MSITEILQENGDCDNDGGSNVSEEVDGEDDDENEDEENSGVAAAGGAPINDGFGVKKVRRGSKSKKLETGLLNQIMSGEGKSAKRS